MVDFSEPGTTTPVKLLFFFTGRICFMKPNPKHPIPEIGTLLGTPYRIWYDSRGMHGHRTEDPSFPLFMDIIPDNYHVFRYGSLSNFPHIPVTLGSTT